jgi:hypothetical protein
MVIVLPRNPAWTLREQFQRLAARRRDLATWLGLNLIALSALCIALSLGPALLAIILSSQKEPVWWLVAALLALVGVDLSRRIAKRGHGLLLELAGAMVANAREGGGEALPRLTAMERGGLRTAKQSLEDLEAVLIAPARLRFPALRETFIHQRQRFSPLYNRSTIASRLELIEMVLTDAGQSEAVEAELYATALYNLSRDARTAIDRVLNGRIPSAGAAIWPNAYAQARIDDRISQDGDPATLRRLVAEAEGWEPLPGTGKPRV